MQNFNFKDFQDSFQNAREWRLSFLHLRVRWACLTSASKVGQSTSWRSAWHPANALTCCKTSHALCQHPATKLDIYSKVHTFGKKCIFIDTSIVSSSQRKFTLWAKTVLCSSASFTFWEIDENFEFKRHRKWRWLVNFEMNKNDFAKDF